MANSPQPPGKASDVLVRLFLVLLLSLGVIRFFQHQTTPPPKHTALVCGLLKRHNTLPLFGGAGHLHRLPQPVAWKAAPELAKDALAVTRHIHRATGIRFKPWPDQAPLPRHGIFFTFGQARNADGSPGCGQAVDFQKRGLTRLVVPARPVKTCPPRRLNLCHETIHALGFAAHIAGNSSSIMPMHDASWPGWAQWPAPLVDAPLKSALRMLYEQPDGAPLDRVCGHDRK